MKRPCLPITVIPAKAGIQFVKFAKRMSSRHVFPVWVPAFAGMTNSEYEEQL
jgi:hypothetical protein